MVKKIVSGGQTGVDRAALDVALELGVPCGGWCPRRRRAEDGPIADRYPLVETASASYGERTRLNVRDSDATLILNQGKLEGGTRLTLDLAQRAGRPVRVVDLDNPPEIPMLAEWIRERGIRTLNVAGPRESGRPGIHEVADGFLRRLLAVIRP